MTVGPPVSGAIEFQRVSHWYRPQLGRLVPALRDVSLRVEPGTVCGLVGANGSGKSTLLRLAAGLARPEKGSVWLDGRPADTVEARRALGYLPDLPTLPEWLTVSEFMRAGGELAGLRPPGLNAEVEAKLAWARLSAVADQGAGTLSKGQRQRLGLAHSLLGDPAVLVLDEPASGLDPAGVADLIARLRELGGKGVTVLLSSHFLRQVEETCDQLVLLESGRVAWSGAGGEAGELEERFMRVAKAAGD